MSEDPIGFAAGDTSLSRYVLNRPIDSVDPSGLWPSADAYVAAPSGGGVLGYPHPIDSGEKSSSRDRIREMLGDNEAAKEYVDQLLRLANNAYRSRNVWREKWTGSKPPRGEPGAGYYGPCGWFVNRLVALWRDRLKDWTKDNPDRVFSGFEAGIGVYFLFDGPGYDGSWSWQTWGRRRNHIAVLVILCDPETNENIGRFYLDAGRYYAGPQGNLGFQYQVFFPEDIPKHWQPGNKE